MTWFVLAPYGSRREDGLGTDGNCQNRAEPCPGARAARAAPRSWFTPAGASPGAAQGGLRAQHVGAEFVQTDNMQCKFLKPVDQAI